MWNEAVRRRTRWLRGDANPREFEDSPFVNRGGDELQERGKGEAAGGCEPFHSVSSPSRCGVVPWEKGRSCPGFSLTQPPRSIDRPTAGLTHWWRSCPALATHVHRRFSSLFETSGGYSLRAPSSGK